MSTLVITKCQVGIHQLPLTFCLQGRYTDGVPKMSRAIRTYMIGVARKGGRARAKALTPQQRRKIARKAARTRWAKRSTC